MPLGLPAYMAWHQPVTRVLADSGRFPDPALSPLLDKLNAEMNKPLPDRQIVAGLAADVKARLDQMLWKLEGATYDREQVLALMRTIVEGSAKHPDVRWYTGTQIAIALTALNGTRKGFEPDKPRSEIDDILRAFRKEFPPPLASQWEKLSKKPQPMTQFLTPLVDLLKD